MGKRLLAHLTDEETEAQREGALHKVTQLVQGRLRIQAQLCPPAKPLSHYMPLVEGLVGVGGGGGSRGHRTGPAGWDQGPSGPNREGGEC